MLAAFAAVVLAASLLGTGLVLRQMQKRAILDHPNPRSSHATPTPLGGGLAVMTAIILGAGAIALIHNDPAAAILLATAGALSAISWWDDLKSLPVSWRLAAQAVAVAIGLGVAGDQMILTQGLLPLWLDHLLAALLWLWFINLFNFMDGIDGISGVEAISIAAGLALIAQIGAADAYPPGAIAYPLTVAAASLGFLYWNWPPARIFLGDVGSIGLGFLLGWLLLKAAGSGHWAAALILPFYYVADASLTLLRRALAGEAVWRAHRSHFYQRAARALGGHARPVMWLIALNSALLALTWLSLLWPDWAGIWLLIAALATGLLLWYFARPHSAAQPNAKSE